ncbi:hypothetical protein EMELA_v1c02350 [Mesoplasma melaleucae]|uniref:Uncharacterized protein n=1 Tax=Mesoplasma melaleucae TaxID=81459 RepID=A0A2K8NX91_9MOLU|nr:hypothetical protein EMELA_v1c02350 [Mesoplasma melaleucae]
MTRKQQIDFCIKNHNNKDTTVTLSSCSYTVCLNCAHKIRNNMC